MRGNEMEEKVIIDCPKCKGKKTLHITRRFLDEEALKLGLYSWSEKCSQCDYEDGFDINDSDWFQLLNKNENSP